MKCVSGKNVKQTKEKKSFRNLFIDQNQFFENRNSEIVHKHTHNDRVLLRHVASFPISMKMWNFGFNYFVRRGNSKNWQRKLNYYEYVVIIHTHTHISMYLVELITTKMKKRTWIQNLRPRHPSKQQKQEQQQTNKAKPITQ